MEHCLEMCETLKITISMTIPFIIATHEGSNSLLIVSHTFPKNPASRESTDTLVALRLAMVSLSSTEELRNLSDHAPSRY